MFTIDFDHKELSASLARAPVRIRTVKRESLERTGRRIANDQRQRLQAAGRVDSERLLKAIDYRVTDRGLVGQLEVGPRVGDPGVEPYDIVVDRGRGKNKPPPPPGALLAFMERKGIPERYEFPIAQKIAREGIPAADYVGPAGRHAVRLMDETSVHVARVLLDA